jgi:hypothetical protein
MKRWIPIVFLPLAFFQSPTFAQTDSAPLPSESSVITAPNSNNSTKKETPVLLSLNGREQINLKLVNCNKSLFLDCGLARLILPGAAFTETYDLRLDNPTNYEVKILKSIVYADGSNINGAAQLSDQESRKVFTLDLRKSLPPNEITILPITINHSLLYPDQYNGSVILTVKDRKDRLSFPINLSVRSGPLLPLFILFLGVVLGRLLKYMQERGEPQAKVLEEVYRLQADIAGAKLEDRDKQLLIDMSKEAQILVVREKLDVAPAQIQTIRDRLDILIKLQSLEDQLVAQATTFPTDVDTFTVDIRKARLYIAQKEDLKAKEILEKIYTSMNDIGGKAAGEDPEIRSMKQSLVDAASATSRIGTASSITIPKKSISGFKMFMITLSGVSDQVRAEAIFWIVRPILSIVLLVGLSFVGMGSLYVEKPTFGANPFADYLGLIIWGMSADFASRKLIDPKGEDGK